MWILSLFKKHDKKRNIIPTTSKALSVLHYFVVAVGKSGKRRKKQLYNKPLHPNK